MSAELLIDLPVDDSVPVHTGPSAAEKRRMRKEAHAMERSKQRTLRQMGQMEFPSEEKRSVEELMALAASVCTNEPQSWFWLLNGGPGVGIAPKDVVEGILKGCGVTVQVKTQQAKKYALIGCDSVAEAEMVVKALSEGLLNTVLGGKDAQVCFALKERLRVKAHSQAVPGVHVVRDFITKEEEVRLLNEIDAREWHKMTMRRVQHYGYAFDYITNDVDLSKPLDDHPHFFSWTLDRVEAQLGDSLVPRRCDQLTLNEYEPGDQIAPHVDTHQPFDDPILSLSLGSHTMMEFRRMEPLDGSVRGDDARIDVLLPPRSLLVLSGEARYAWTHAIRARSTDMVDGEVVPRSRRVSLTFRRVLTAPVCKCPFVSYCPTQLAAIEAAATPSETAVERKHVADVYNVIAAHFSATRYKPWPKVAAFVAALPKGSLLIDVGCGNGRYMSRDHPIVHLGLDRSIGLLEQCRGQDDARHATLGSGLELPYRDACADAVMSIAVIHHYSTASRRLDALREAVRVLRVGGRLLVTAWAREQKKFAEEPSPDLFVTWKNTEDGVEYKRYYHLFEKGELDAMFNAVPGLRVLESYEDADNWHVVAAKEE